MPEQRTLQRARRDKRKGKSPSTQAGEFVREEIHHVREGKHGAASAKQAIAIGLSKARRAGVDLPPPKTGIRTYEEAGGSRERGGQTEAVHAEVHSASARVATTTSPGRTLGREPSRAGASGPESGAPARRPRAVPERDACGEDAESGTLTGRSRTRPER